jgi:hypothetical protein
MAERRAHAMTGGSRWVQRAVRLAQQVMCALYIAVALVGVPVTRPMLLLTAAPAVGCIAAGLLAGLLRLCEQRPPARRTMMVTAGAAAAIVPFDEGMQLLQGLGTAIAVTLLVLMSIVGNYRMNELAVRARADATGAGGAESYAELLHVVSLDTVFGEWRALEEGVAIRTGEEHGPDVMQVRALLLDEMQRRDPVGFGRWLDDGAADDPERHIQVDRGLAA